MSTRLLVSLFAALQLGALFSTSSAAQQATAVPGDTALALPITPVRTLRFTTDEALRNEIYHDVQARALEIVPWIYTIRRTQGEAMASYVKGYVHLESWSPITQREIWLDK